MSEKKVGRSPDSDIVIYDPQKRVSRTHLIVKCVNGNICIKDNNSVNGTFVNGKKIKSDVFIKINRTDQVTLSKDYLITKDINELFKFESLKGADVPTDKRDATIVFEGERATFQNGSKKVIFDTEKTSISDLSDSDQTSFVTIGRSDDNKIVIRKSFISRHHCRIRLLLPTVVEIEDLGSSNGTFADNEKLIPNKKIQFASSVRIRFGDSFNLNLKKVFPEIKIIDKKQQLQPPKVGAIGQPIQQHELKAFNELEEIWNEYTNRQNQISNKASSFAIAGSALGIVASVFTGGIMSPIMMGGGGLLGRYLGQQETNKIKGDLNYENAFLSSYCCPRCKESFQKKPWITINDCFKCKLKFR